MAMLCPIYLACEKALAFQAVLSNTSVFARRDKTLSGPVSIQTHVYITIYIYIWWSVGATSQSAIYP